MTKKPMVRSGRDDMTARVLHVDDAVPLDARRGPTPVRFSRSPASLGDRGKDYVKIEAGDHLKRDALQNATGFVRR